MPDADETRRQDVLEEEPGELRPADGALFCQIAIGAILLAERDGLAVVNGDA